MQVLIIDDNDFIRSSMEKFLGASGFRITCASSGDEALSILSNYDKPIDIVITDVVMPGRDGFDIIEEINNHRAIGRKLGVIAMSGGGKTIDANTALEALGGSADTFLRKPFRQTELLEAMTDLIEKYQLKLYFSYLYHRLLENVIKLLSHLTRWHHS